MTTLTMPSAPGFSRASFALRSNTLAFTSPLNGASQTLEFPGAAWAFNASIAKMNRATAAAWQAFFMQLRGSAGRFYVSDPSAPAPRGTALGSPVVAGSNQVGNTLVTSGWTASQTQALLPGDYFQIGNELKMVVSTVASDGSGNATITFEPPIRVSPSNGSAVIVSNPKCIMRLTDNSQTLWDVEPGKIYSMSIAAIEALV